MTTDVPTALAAATLQRAQSTRERAREALRQLDRDGLPVTFAAVADTAGVSRSLLYRDPDLRAEIETLRPTQPAPGPGRPPAIQRSTDASLQRRLTAALDDNRALRAENGLLRDQIAIMLGQQRAATVPLSTRGQTIGPCS